MSRRKRRKSSGWNRLLFVLVMVLVLMGGFRVKALASAQAAPTKNYISVQIHTGDTLWSVAEEYCEGTSDREIRNYVNEIKGINHIVNDRALTPGAYLTVYTIDR
ncbi:MAG: LysM peptidoglycan-binding domain-containing protein [Lachnospiraceae bacterium]|nr:LysM peptidoglycan-binding domain-containing protein [Lachnospiraceae bacterium]